MSLVWRGRPLSGLTYGRFLVLVFAAINCMYPLVLIVYVFFFDNDYLRLTKGFEVGTATITRVFFLYLFVVLGLLGACLVKLPRVFDRRRKLRVSISYRVINLVSLFFLLLYFAVFANYFDILSSGYLHLMDTDISRKILSYNGLLDVAIFSITSIRIVYAKYSDRRVFLSDILLLALYVFIKVLFKARFGIVIYLSIVFYGVVFCWDRKLSVVKLFRFCFLLFIVFVFVNAYRGGFDVFTFSGLFNAFFSFGLEFYLGSISLLNVIDFVDQGYSLNAIAFFLDPILFSFPSFLYGTPEAREGFIAYIQFVDSVGGSEIFNPAGGSLLPAQLYLSLNSYFGVMLFYFIYGLLVRFFVSFLEFENQYLKSVSLLALSMLFFSSFRTEFYIFGSFFIRNVLIFNFIIFLFFFSQKHMVKK